MLRARHVLAAALLLAACGGRYASIDGGDGGSSSGATTGSGGTGQGGKQPGGKAGTATVGGSVSVAGTSSGTAGTTVGTGGKAMCGPCPDIDVECGFGYSRQRDPSGCCEVCVPLDCRMVPCPGIACGPGSQLIYPPDQCCPVCGPSDCEAQRSGYYEFRSQVLAKYGSLGCMQDADCTLVYEGNACASGCGTPIPWFYEKEVIVALEDYANEACSLCPPLPVPPCPAAPPPACVNGRCQYRQF